MQEDPRPAVDDPWVERRAPQTLLYGADQLLGRAPIRLRRRSDKIRFAAHLSAAVALVALTAWWLVPLHWFAGPVVLSLTASHGVHAGDLPALLFLAGAVRSLVVSWRLASPGRAAPLAP